MGYLYVSGKFYGTVSRHNSNRDKEHNALWLDYIKRITEIAEEEKYKDIILHIDADTEDTECTEDME